MRRFPKLVAGALVLSACSLFAQQSTEEQAVWKQEQAYWKYVQAGDLVDYSSLWDATFVGWPNSSATPAHKNHITNWITAYTAKGQQLKSYVLKPADSQSHGNIVLTYYWITTVWADKDGHEERETGRITHTWMQVGSRWQIIGGMSSVVPTASH